MIQLYGYPKCSTCKKAEKWFALKNEPIEYVDIVNATPTAAQLAAWIDASHLPTLRFFNTSGQKYRELGLKDQVPTFTVEEAAEVLASDGMLIKRPLVIKDGAVAALGFKEDTYAEVFG
jgi:arsenate reductase